MSTPEYLEGLAFFLLTMGSVGGAALLVVRRRFGGLRGVPRVLAFAVSAAGLLVLVHLVPGALGILGRWPVLVCALLALAVCRLLPGARPYREGSEPPAPVQSTGRLLGASAALAAAAVAIVALADAIQNAGVAPGAIDLLTFQLPAVARWVQSGTLLELTEFVADRSGGHYPQNGNVAQLALILPWENDFLVRFYGLPCLAALGLSAYALGCEVGAPRGIAVLVASAVAGLPIVLAGALGSLPDVFCQAAFAAGLLFLLRHWRTGLTRELVLAGIALGLALGTKWYALPAVAVVAGVWGAAWLLARRSPRSLARPAAVLWGAIAAGGGFWLVRNTVLSSNPVYPVKVDLLGVTLFDAPPDLARELQGDSLAAYIFDSEAWADDLLPAYEQVFGAPGLLLLAGLVIAGVLAAARRGAQSRGLVLAAVAAAGAITAIYVVTPYTAGGPVARLDLVAPDSRYLVPALIVAAPLLAWCAARSRPAAVLVSLAALAAVAQALGARQAPSANAFATAFALLAGALAVTWALTRRSALVMPAAGLALAVACLAGYALQDRFNDSRYVGLDPVTDALRAESPDRVGLVGGGFAFVYPAFGPRLKTEVEPAARLERGYLRPYTRRAELLAAVRRGRYDLLLAALGGDFNRPGLSARQIRWLEEDGWTVLSRSPGQLLLRRAG